MDLKVYGRDHYDLCYTRLRTSPPHDKEEPEGDKAKQDRLNERRRRLNSIGKDLRTILQMKDALISSIHFVSQHLHEPGDSTAEVQKRLPRPPRPDTDTEEEILTALLASARLPDPSIKILTTSLKLLNLALLQRAIDSPGTPQDPAAVQEQQPTVFYRFSNERSQTSFDAHLGLYPPRGLLDHDFDEPLEYEFRAHVDGDFIIPSPHDKCGRFRSPFISLTTDAGRVLKIGDHKMRHGPAGLQHEVYQIDAVKLRRMKIEIEATTDVAERWHIVYTGQGEDRLRYVTRSHWLARFWVPAECIVGKLPFGEFEKLCREHGIVLNRDNYDVALGRELPAAVFERRCESLQPRPRSVVFVSDDEDPIENFSGLSVGGR